MWPSAALRTGERRKRRTNEHEHSCWAEAEHFCVQRGGRIQQVLETKHEPTFRAAVSVPSTSKRAMTRGFLAGIVAEEDKRKGCVLLEELWCIHRAARCRCRSRGVRKILFARGRRQIIQKRFQARVPLRKSVCAQPRDRDWRGGNSTLAQARRAALSCHGGPPGNEQGSFSRVRRVSDLLALSILQNPAATCQHPSKIGQPSLSLYSRELSRVARGPG